VPALRLLSFVFFSSVLLVPYFHPGLRASKTKYPLELSIAPELNNQIVPPHARPALEAQGLDINNFKPLSKEEMMAHLD
jgi:hypothetical protein